MAVKDKPRKRPEICANVLKVPAESDASGRVCCNHVIRTCAPAQCCAIHSRKVDGPRIFLSKNSRAATRSAAPSTCQKTVLTMRKKIEVDSAAMRAPPRKE